MPDPTAATPEQYDLETVEIDAVPPTHRCEARIYLRRQCTERGRYRVTARNIHEIESWVLCRVHALEVAADEMEHLVAD